MNFKSFIRDKLILIVGILVASAVALVLLIAESVSPFAIILIELLFIGAGAAGLFTEYNTKKEFYNSLEKANPTPQQFGAISDMIPEPEWEEGKTTYHAIQKVERSVYSKVTFFQNDSEELRRYMETWAHDIEAPLSRSLSLSESDGIDDTEDLHRDLIAVSRKCDEALFFCRSGRVGHDFVLTQAELSDIVLDAVKQMAPDFIREKVLIKPGNLLDSVCTDTEWTKFILSKIFENCLKFKNPEGQNTVTISSRAEGQGVVLTVSDTGLGIVPHEIPRVFEKNFQGESAKGGDNGTGLGLFLVKRLCDKLGLEITVSSQQGEGTDISILFPRRG